MQGRPLQFGLDTVAPAIRLNFHRSVIKKPLNRSRDVIANIGDILALEECHSSLSNEACFAVEVIKRFRDIREAKNMIGLYGEVLPVPVSADRKDLLVVRCPPLLTR